MPSVCYIASASTGNNAPGDVSHIGLPTMTALTWSALIPGNSRHVLKENFWDKRVQKNTLYVSTRLQPSLLEAKGVPKTRSKAVCSKDEWRTLKPVFTNVALEAFQLKVGSQMVSFHRGDDNNVGAKIDYSYQGRIIPMMVDMQFHKEKANPKRLRSLCTNLRIAAGNAIKIYSDRYKSLPDTVQGIIYGKSSCILAMPVGEDKCCWLLTCPQFTMDDLRVLNDKQSINDYSSYAAVDQLTSYETFGSKSWTGLKLIDPDINRVHVFETDRASLKTTYAAIAKGERPWKSPLWSAKGVFWAAQVGEWWWKHPSRPQLPDSEDCVITTTAADDCVITTSEAEDSVLTTTAAGSQSAVLVDPTAKKGETKVAKREPMLKYLFQLPAVIKRTKDESRMHIRLGQRGGYAPVMKIKDHDLMVCLVGNTLFCTNFDPHQSLVSNLSRWAKRYWGIMRFALKTSNPLQPHIVLTTPHSGIIPISLDVTSKTLRAETPYHTELYKKYRAFWPVIDSIVSEFADRKLGPDRPKSQRVSRLMTYFADSRVPNGADNLLINIEPPSDEISVQPEEPEQPVYERVPLSSKVHADTTTDGSQDSSPLLQRISSLRITSAQPCVPEVSRPSSYTYGDTDYLSERLEPLEESEFEAQSDSTTFNPPVDSKPDANSMTAIGSVQIKRGLVKNFINRHNSFIHESGVTSPVRSRTPDEIQDYHPNVGLLRGKLEQFASEYPEARSTEEGELIQRLLHANARTYLHRSESLPGGPRPLVPPRTSQYSHFSRDRVGGRQPIEPQEMSQKIVSPLQRSGSLPVGPRPLPSAQQTPQHTPAPLTRTGSMPRGPRPWRGPGTSPSPPLLSPQTRTAAWVADWQDKIIEEGEGFDYGSQQEMGGRRSNYHQI